MGAFTKAPEQRKKTHVRVSLGISGGEEDPLGVIRGITEGMKNLESEIGAAVRRARKAGHTWDEVGEALGVSRQAAWERYAVD